MTDARTGHVWESASAKARGEASPVHRILVVDDDITIRHLNTAMLLRSGYEVDAAEDGEAAWQALNTDTYDLLITDNSMPKLSGVELLKRLRATHMELPVIMATGTLPAEEFNRYPWLKPAATLLKPYAGAEMLSTVKTVLRETDTAAAPCQRPKCLARRILVVDEDCDLRRLYAEALTRPGCHVDVAEAGVAGWEALQVHHYNLLITEHDLPDLSGIELVRKLRAARMALPVVMAANRLPMDELAQNPTLQLSATLLKPFVLDALLDTVNSVMHATDHSDTQSDSPPNWQSQPR